MNSFDAELKKLREQISRSEQLKKRLQSLYPLREQLTAREQELREIRVEEQDDVDRLEGRSLARYFYSLTGGLEERLDRERMEARAAAVKHDAVLNELRDLEEDISDTESELSSLRGCEERYDAVLERKAEALKQSGSPVAEKLRALERRAAFLERQLRETDEAISAGRHALSIADNVIDSLSSASTWSMVDVFSDSILADAIKYGSIDDAQRSMEELNVALRRFGTELGDVGGRIDVGMDSFLGFADVFFDNIFTDLAVRSHISASLDSAELTHRRIETALSRLYDLRTQCANESERLENEYDNTVTGA